MNATLIRSSHHQLASYATLATRRLGSTPTFAPTRLGLGKATLPLHRSFSSSRSILNPQPSSNVKSRETDSTFQAHPVDVQKGVGGLQSRPTVSSRPHEDWALAHPVYTPEEVDAVKVVRHPRVTLGDKIAAGMVYLARKGFDLVTGYRHSSPEAAREALRKAGKENQSIDDLIRQGYIMSVDQWLARILFLESIAGVPGMVAGSIRHLRSLRLMKHDGGWINVLLQEAENERMHLMTFMKIKNPGLFFRAIIIAAQGVFYNAFFLAYMLSPRAAHRFVGCLEEEACLTYTQILDEISRGHIPQWDSVRNPNAVKVPGIALDYWRLPSDATMLDLIKQVRADEAGHRFTNHTLANLDYKSDHNPLGLKHATAQMQGEEPGMTREQSLDWLKKVEVEMRSQIEQGAHHEGSQTEKEASS